MTAAAELTAHATPRASQADEPPGILRLKKHFPFLQRSISAFSWRSDGTMLGFLKLGTRAHFQVASLKKQEHRSGRGDAAREAQPFAETRRNPQNGGVCILLPTGTYASDPETTDAQHTSDSQTPRLRGQGRRAGTGVLRLLSTATEPAAQCRRTRHGSRRAAPARG